MLDLTEQVLTKFGFTDYEIMLSTRPEKAVGSDEIWEQACIYAHAVLMWACGAHADVLCTCMLCTCCAHAVHVQCTCMLCTCSAHAVYVHAMDEIWE